MDVGCCHQSVHFSGLIAGFSFRQEQEIIVVTPPRPAWAAVGAKLELRGVYIQDDEIKTDQDFEFEYRSNPVVNSVYPQLAMAV